VIASIVRLAALGSLVAATPAAADHGGPLRNAPMSPLTAAILFAGLALLVGAVVIVVVRVLTKEREALVTDRRRRRPDRSGRSSRRPR
jgi:hypothetical protein